MDSPQDCDITTSQKRIISMDHEEGANSKKPKISPKPNLKVMSCQDSHLPRINSRSSIQSSTHCEATSTVNSQGSNTDTRCNIKAHVKKFIEEKKQYVENFKICSKQCKEAMDKYNCALKTFKEYEKFFLKSLREMRQYCPFLADIPPLIDDSEDNDNEDQQIEALMSKNENNKVAAIANMEATCSMIILHRTFDQLASLYQELSVNVNLATKKVFLKQLVELEDSYVKELEVFKEIMKNTLMHRESHKNSTSQNNLEAKYDTWFKKLHYNLQTMYSKRQQLALMWCQENNTESQMKEKNSIIPTKDNSKTKFTMSSHQSQALCIPELKVMNNQEAVSKDVSTQINSQPSNVCNIDQNVNNKDNQYHNYNKECVNDHSNAAGEDVGGTDHHQNQEHSEECNYLDLCNPEQQHKSPVIENHASNDSKIRREDAANSDRIDESVDESHQNNYIVNEEWPGKSLPVLDDLISLNEQYQYKQFVYNSSGKQLLELENNSKSQVYDKDEVLFKDFPIQTDSELSSPAYNRDFQFTEGHFLEPEAILSTEDQVFTNTAISHNKPMVDLPSTSLKPSSESMFTCPLCLTLCDNDLSLSAHLKVIHSPQLCQQCKLAFAKDLFDLDAHVRDHHKLFKVCFVCGEIIKQVEFTDHEKMHNIEFSKNKKTFKCKDVNCKKAFSTMEKLEIHEKKHKSLCYRCEHCDSSYKSRYEIQKHKTEHLANRLKRYVCKVCYAHFDGYDRLMKHIKLGHQMQENKQPEEEGGRIECLVCYFVFDNKEKLIEHIKVDHQHDSLAIKAAAGDGNGKVKDRCPYCDKYFKNQKVKAVHVIIHHESAPYICPCNAQFYTKGSLDFHVIKHTKSEETMYNIIPIKGGKKKSKIENDSSD